MRRNRTRLLAQVALDAFLINAAIFISWFIRYELEVTPPLGEGFFYQPFIAYLPFALIVTIPLIGIFRFDGLYANARGRSFFDEIYMLVNGATTGVVLLMAITFIARPLVYSRAVYIYSAVLIVILLGLERLIIRIVRGRRRKHGQGVDRVLIVGAGEVGRALMRNIVAQPDLGYQVVGFIDDHYERGHTDIGRFKALGGTDALPNLLRELAVDEVIVTLPWSARKKIIGIMNLCQRQNVTAKIVPDLFQLSLSRVAIDDVGGVPLIAVREIKIGMWDTVLKRALDLTLAVFSLIIAMPVMFLVALAIRLDSPGPALFVQQRVGRSGKYFSVYKFRTMRVGAEEEVDKLRALNEADGPLFKIKNDPRNTRLGRLLRRTSLDELPQLLNVLRGEMSIVGPRPAIPNEVEHYQEWHKRRLEVSPGMTGLWQVSGRSELTFDEMVMLDIYYIENWTPWMDVWIMLKTVPTVLFARGAY